uniref:Uncharacterized protein n=1 Tax=Romanomermis culicivorax TaxID=13658 RepID=A0A915L4K4_ROMCU
MMVQRWRVRLVTRNQPLPCERTGYADYHTKADFKYSRTNEKSSVDITFMVDKECRLNITVEQNGTKLVFNDSMSWGY